MAGRWFAPAKLNLYLHVTGRRPDGYHFLDSLAAFVSIGDELWIEHAADLALTITGPFAHELSGDPRQNLVWCAAASLSKRLAITPRIAITLVKNLPVASGIGGGSSDAAACLRALATRWGCGHEMMMEVARPLGSDIAACLVARPVWLGGVGENLEIAREPPSCGVVLVNPRMPLATPAVYGAFRGPFSKAGRFVMPFNARALAGLLAERRNDLTETACRLVPAIGDVLERLGTLDRVLLVRMSGSGATCFALFETANEAEIAARRLGRACPDWWVASGKLLDAFN